jgi:hypothetical protein
VTQISNIICNVTEGSIFCRVVDPAICKPGRRKTSPMAQAQIKDEMHGEVLMHKPVAETN